MSNFPQQYQSFSPLIHTEFNQPFFEFIKKSNRNLQKIFDHDLKEENFLKNQSLETIQRILVSMKESDGTSLKSVCLQTNKEKFEKIFDKIVNYIENSVIVAHLLS